MDLVMKNIWILVSIKILHLQPLMPILLMMTCMIQIILISITSSMLLNPRLLISSLIISGLLKSILVIIGLLKSSLILPGIDGLMLSLMTCPNTMHTMRLPYRRLL